MPFSTQLPVVSSRYSPPVRSLCKSWWRQERQKTEQRWYLWPITLLLAAYGVGGLAWCLYNGWWAGAAFMTFWTTALIVMGSPSKVGWEHRKSARLERRE